MLLGLCLLAGVGYLGGVQPPSSVEAVMPTWLVYAWYVALTGAGAVAVVGNLWPGTLRTALLVRLSGQLLAAGPAAAFAVAAFSYAGQQALYVGGLTAAFAAASVWTAKHLRDDLMFLRRIR